MLSHPQNQVIRAYLHAKDHQRPHAFSRAFAEDAVFHTTFGFHTDWHSTEPKHGLPAISGAFRQLGAAFENIVTICLPEAVQLRDDGVAMPWVVAMTARDGDALRLAWGDYLWRFTEDGARASYLHVHMEAMHLVEGPGVAEWLDWALGLPDVWCPGREAARRLPSETFGLREFLTPEAQGPRVSAA